MEYKTADTVNDGAKIYKKIQRGKRIFLEAGIKPTGRNTFQKYNYLEMKDIEPTILDVCEELQLSTRFVFSATSANLIIRDEEDSREVYYSLPLPAVKVDDARKAMQEIGSIQTYAMRYLYIQAFEIVVTDTIDKGNSTQKVEHKTYASNSNKSKNTRNKQYIQKNRKVQPDMAEPVNQSKLNLDKKVSTTELVNMSKTVENSLKQEGKPLNEQNIHSKVDELYKNSNGYNELIKMFDNGLKKAKKQESGYITY
ncbi:ERF family protein [Methanosphaera sp.]|jgi:hypothetical protein|uniref:ERF family protein n=1 Tax=Methanosphaera sp. TaxID=2666342 RepID=UPI003D911050